MNISIEIYNYLKYISEIFHRILKNAYYLEIRINWNLVNVYYKLKKEKNKKLDSNLIRKCTSILNESVPRRITEESTDELQVIIISENINSVQFRTQFYRRN